jgi:hypothetical protein
MLSALPGLNLTLLEPESDFLLGVLDTVGTVANVTSNCDGTKVSTIVIGIGLGNWKPV